MTLSHTDMRALVMPRASSCAVLRWRPQCISRLSGSSAKSAIPIRRWRFSPASLGHHLRSARPCYGLRLPDARGAHLAQNPVRSVNRCPIANASGCSMMACGKCVASAIPAGRHQWTRLARRAGLASLCGRSKTSHSLWGLACFSRASIHRARAVRPATKSVQSVFRPLELILPWAAPRTFARREVHSICTPRG